MSGLGGFLPEYHALRGKGFFLPWVIFHLWDGKRGFFRLRAYLAKKNCIFRVFDDFSLPRRKSVRLSESENLHTKDRCYTLIRLGQVGVRNQQNLYPRTPNTDVAKLLQYNGSRVEHRDGFYL